MDSIIFDYLEKLGVNRGAYSIPGTEQYLECARVCHQLKAAAAEDLEAGSIAGVIERGL